MSENAGDVLDYLREQFARVHGRFDRIDADMRDLKVRMTSVEEHIASLHAFGIG